MTRAGRRTRLAGLALAGLIALSGCGFKGAYSLPLPGGNATGAAYHVTAIFDNVQDLVPDSAVRVDDVAVGDVTSITYDPKDNKAHVHMRIKKSVHLPANAVATLEQTTLLGEKYIAIDFPQNQAATGQLRDGAVIPYQRTSDLPDVEQLFGALSAVLNGGDLQDLQTINIEISKALTGREAAVKDALSQLDTFVTSLNGQRQQIVRALDALDRFSGQLAKGNADIATALDNLGPGLKVLADERAQFTTLLTDLANFGRVASHIIRSSRAQTVAGLRDLQPILQHLSAAGTNLPHALELLVTYPFPRNIDKAVPGDYNGLYLSFNADPVFCALVPLPLPTCPSKPVAPTSTGTSKPTTKTSGLTKKAKRLLKKLPKLPLPDPGNVLEQLLGGGLTGVGR
ncbi:MAG: MCE family protein [Frankiales bacterium]|nr:MCE family protein [Frankiales bacterium]